MDGRHEDTLMKRSPMKRRPRPSTPEERAWYKRIHDEIPACVLCGRYGIQVAHRNGAGMALKADYHDTAALCPTCHHECDNGNTLTLDERRRLMDQAIEKTHRLLDIGG